MTENNKDNNSSKAASFKRRTTAVLTLLFLTAAGIACWTVYQRSGLGLTTRDGSIVPASSQTDALHTAPGPMVDLKEFLVNIISEDNGHYLKTSITLELSDTNTQKEVEARRAQVRDAILMLISNKTFEELYDLHGKKQLKAEITLTVNDVLTGGSVTAVYLTDFVVQ